jgi:hypothetical protein
MSSARLSVGHVVDVDVAALELTGRRVDEPVLLRLCSTADLGKYGWFSRP